LKSVILSILFAVTGLAQAAENASPIYGVTLPDGYRNWEFIAPRP